MTLHSNKLISPEHPAFSIYRKRETRNPDDWLWGEGVTFVLAGVAASPLTAVLISFRYPDLPKVLPSLALLIPDTLAAAVILYPWYRERERERERDMYMYVLNLHSNICRWKWADPIANLRESEEKE